MAKKFDLEKLAGGAFSESVNQVMQQVMENIADPNTPYEKKRKATITMTFKANEDRNITNVDIVSKPTLAPREGIHTNIIIDRSLNGEIVAAEYGKQIPGQQAMKINQDTGEIVNNNDKEKDEKSLDGLKVVK